MRLFPDKNFKQSFKNHYNDNYTKINNKFTSGIDSAHLYLKQNPQAIKSNICGAMVVFLIIGILMAAGLCMSKQMSKQKQEILNLQNNISIIDAEIDKCEVINESDLNDQITDVVTNVVSLQNQYCMNTFSKDFDSKVSQYLGAYCDDWAKDIKTTSSSISWKGYINQACDFTDSAEFVFVFYEDKKPRLIVVANYSIKDMNIVGLTKITKQEI